MVMLFKLTASWLLFLFLTGKQYSDGLVFCKVEEERGFPFEFFGRELMKIVLNIIYSFKQ